MDILFSLLFSFALLIISVTKGVFIAYPLLSTLVIMIFVYLKRGFQLNFLLEIALIGSRKSFSVLSILLLIGAVTAAWMAAGTVPALVYYGLQLIQPQYFILLAFISTSFISTLIGTSFGTVSTIGIALMIMARGSNVNPDMIAGAIVAGAYFGDRCSPMSSSAHLVASITKTDIYTNIKNMVRTAILPLFISIFFYLVLSQLNPVQSANSTLAVEINKLFDIHTVVLTPAFVILILSVLRWEVKLTMLLSLITALVIGIVVQGYSLIQLLQFIVFGYQLEASPLQEVLSGGGVISMAKVSIVVIVSTALAGLFAGTKTLDAIKTPLHKTKSRDGLFLETTVIGLASAALGCTQTIAILLTEQIVKHKYAKEKLGHYKLALDLENTAVVLSPLIPWNIAGLVPATLLMTDSGFIPYAFYLYCIPLLNLLQFKLSKNTV